MSTSRRLSPRHLRSSRIGNEHLVAGKVRVRLGLGIVGDVVGSEKPTLESTILDTSASNRTSNLVGSTVDSEVGEGDFVGVASGNRGTSYDEVSLRMST
jgi:hypothetical protein